MIEKFSIYVAAVCANQTSCCLIPKNLKDCMLFPDLSIKIKMKEEI